MEVIIKMENLKRLTVQIRQQQYLKLKEMTRPGVSISFLVRSAIEGMNNNSSDTVTFQKSSYSEYESNSIKGLKQIHALLTLKKYDVITEQEYSNIRNRLDSR